MTLPPYSLSVDELRVALSYSHPQIATTSTESTSKSNLSSFDSAPAINTKSRKSEPASKKTKTIANKRPPRTTETSTMTSSAETIEVAVLTALSSSEDIAIPDTFPWSVSQRLDHLKVIGAIKSLEADHYVLTEPLSTSFYESTAQGQSVLDDGGSQEVMVLKALIEAGGLSMPDLQQVVGKDVSKIGMANCMKEKWIKKEGDKLVPIVALDAIEDKAYKLLQSLIEKKGAEDALDAAVRRFSTSFVKESCINEDEIHLIIYAKRNISSSCAFAVNHTTQKA